MSEFWWGVMALPIILASTAGAAAAVFGAWLTIERWARGRWGKLQPVSFPHHVGGKLDLWTAGDLGKRGQFAASILAGGTVRGFGIGTWAILAAGGKPDPTASRMIEKALRAALLDVAKAEGVDTRA